MVAASLTLSQALQRDADGVQAEYPGRRTPGSLVFPSGSNLRCRESGIDSLDSRVEPARSRHNCGVPATLATPGFSYYARDYIGRLPTPPWGERPRRGKEI